MNIILILFLGVGNQTVIFENCDDAVGDSEPTFYILMYYDVDNWFSNFIFENKKKYSFNFWILMHF